MFNFTMGIIVGAAAGAWGYRYWLKTHPESLEKLAAGIKNSEHARKFREALERGLAKAQAKIRSWDDRDPPPPPNVPPTGGAV